VGVLSGQVQFVFDSYALLPHIKSGKLRALAVTSKKRMMVLPDLPTVAEQTKTDFEVVGQLGYVVPAATPRDIVNRLNAAINKTMASPDLIQQIRTQGGEPLTMSPAEFDNLIKQESVKWLKIIREAGIKPE
jgi:tripartite-type tricarboxylate transporter receptor subunit TctC